jgi:hypothetical protein
MTIAICAAICGANNWVEVEIFGKAKQEWLATFLELPNGIPSHDTYCQRIYRVVLSAGQHDLFSLIKTTFA